MTATEDEIAKLLSLLADNKSNSFNSTGAAFSSTFPSSRRFAAGQALAVLLQHADLLPVVEDRVNAIFILYFLRHREPPTNNPFLAIFDSIIKAPPSSASGSPPPVPYCLTPCEKAFATQLISGSNNELLKQSASSFCQAFNQSVQPPPARQELDSLLQAQATLDKPARYLSSMFHHPDRTTMAAQGPQTPQATAALVSEAQSMSDLSLSPGFVRVSPPVLPIASSETSWMVPRGTDARVRYNDTLGVDKPRARADDELRRIITHATQEVIPLERQQEIMAKLQADHQLVFRIGMTPEKLPGIVNKNPVLSVEILLRLMSSTQITDYFSMLVNMPLTLQCMEVVNKLTQTVELPSEFIHLYISNCISACEALEDNKYMQSRLVRLVCVFLNSLIRNKIINVKNLFIEVQAFCIEFAKIKEAAMLFRLLKQLDDKGHAPPEALSPKTAEGGVKSASANLAGEPEDDDDTPDEVEALPEANGHG